MDGVGAADHAEHRFFELADRSVEIGLKLAISLRDFLRHAIGQVFGGKFRQACANRIGDRRALSGDRLALALLVAAAFVIGVETLFGGFLF